MKATAFFFFLIAFLSSKSQEKESFVFEKSFAGTYSDFEVDILGNHYLLSEKNQLKKTNAKGDSIGVFNDIRRYGKISSMDVTNPLKCLIYFKNFSTIIVLDRFLQPINTIDLRKQSIFQVKAVAQSYDNKIWIYDEQNQQLKKIDDNGNVLLSTPDLRMAFDEVPSPEKIVDQEGYVYLYDPAKGVYVFDIYGSFKTKISYLQLYSFSVFGKTMVGISEGMIITYGFGTLTEKKYPLPSNQKVEKWIIHPGKLYGMRKEGIDVYSIKQ